MKSFTNYNLQTPDLKAVNQTLKDNNKHYWLFTALISIGCAILGVILGHYF